MAIIWNQPPAPDFSPIETDEEMKEWVEASMDAIEEILKEAEEDEQAPAIVEEIQEACQAPSFRGFGH